MFVPIAHRLRAEVIGRRSGISTVAIARRVFVMGRGRFETGESFQISGSMAKCLRLALEVDGYLREHGGKTIFFARLIRHLNPHLKCRI